MKKVKSILMYFLIAPIAINSFGQANVNPTITVLPGNSGVVAVGANLDLQITVGATTASSGTVAAAKLRPGNNSTRICNFSGRWTSNRIATRLDHFIKYWVTTKNLQHRRSYCWWYIS
jgi:hypothetical protein